MTPEETAVQLENLGWDDYFEEQFRQLALPDTVPARISSEQRRSYMVMTAAGELTANVSGKMLNQSEKGYRLPAIGDWVALSPRPDERKGVIRTILPRKSSFSRQISGGRDRRSGGQTGEQVLAANIDTAFIVNGLDGGRNANLRRIERYLTLAWASGASPVIVLNKADLCTNIEGIVGYIESAVQGVPVHAISAATGWELDSLKAYLAPGKTGAFLGLSGVGKSSIINALLGSDRLKVGEVRIIDRRGRHTTTHRELFHIPGGGMVIDTPGMREIQLWADDEALSGAFPDIERYADECRFSDCCHDTEPGCAVRAAIERGELDGGRLLSYRKLQREVRYLEARQDDRTRLEEKTRWKQISQWAKQIKKRKR